MLGLRNLVLTTATVVVATTTVIAVQSTPSVWDGVYTGPQAQRGEQAYAADCASCHGKTLEGGGQAPPLTGTEFIGNWVGPLADLDDRIQTTMPADQPGRLTASRTIDIVAYLLKANGFPEGSRELPADGDTLKRIQVTRQATK